MSGFEVVGVVLGVLPLAVAALKGYRGVLPFMRDVDLDLEAIIRDLECEETQLRNTCELLLDGVAELSVIDTLIQNPFGAEWEPYMARLEVRLYDGSERFREQLLALESACQELREKLSLESNSKAILSTKKGILNELLHNASFTLRRKDYQTTIDKIVSANHFLYNRAKHDCGEEPKRRCRSQARLTSLIRTVSRNIFNALSASSNCCSGLHQGCMGLIPRHAVIVPSDTDDSILQRFDFPIALAPTRYHVRTKGKNATAVQDDTNWHNLSVRLTERVVAPPSVMRPVNTRPRDVPVFPETNPIKKIIHKLKGVSKSGKQGKKIKEQAEQEYPFTEPVTLAFHRIDQSLINRSPKYTLCRVIMNSNRGKDRPTEPHCHMTDGGRTFALYTAREDEPNEFNTTFTLRQILQGNPDKQPKRFPPFDYSNRLEVSLALAINILHLFKTPWLPEMLTLDDIVFLFNDESKGQPHRTTVEPFTQLRPFVMRTLSADPETTHNATKGPQVQTPRPVNIALLSLGALLVQVITGRHIEALDMARETIINISSILAIIKTADNYDDHLLVNGGPDYRDAVKWCMKNVLNTKGLRTDIFCQEYYQEVVGPLQSDLNNMYD